MGQLRQPVGPQAGGEHLVEAASARGGGTQGGFASQGEEPGGVALLQHPFAIKRRQESGSGLPPSTVAITSA